MGGSDEHNFTLNVISASDILKLRNTKINVIGGEVNPNIYKLKAASMSSNCNISLLMNVSNMAEQMAVADIGIVSGGTTSLEAAFMGLPSIVLVLSNNQKKVAEYLAKEKVSWYLECNEYITEKLTTSIKNIYPAVIREQMSNSGRKLIDGLGCKRVIGEILIAQH